MKVYEESIDATGDALDRRKRKTENGDQRQISLTQRIQHSSKMTNFLLLNGQLTNGKYDRLCGIYWANTQATFCIQKQNEKRPRPSAKTLRSNYDTYTFISMQIYSNVILFLLFIHSKYGHSMMICLHLLQFHDSVVSFEKNRERLIVNKNSVYDPNVHIPNCCFPL